jgi:hypothetical protein
MTPSPNSEDRVPKLYLDDDEALSEQFDDAQNISNEATSGNPGDLTWGFFSYGDAPPAIGGGLGMFTWFEDRETLLSFIADVLPYFPPGPSGSDFRGIEDKTREIIEEMRSGTISDLEGTERLNGVLKRFSQIEWIGTVDDLLSGSHPYAIEVRAAFRYDEENPDDPDNGSAITEEEREDFFEMLDTWGI